MRQLISVSSYHDTSYLYMHFMNKYGLRTVVECNIIHCIDTSVHYYIGTHSIIVYSTGGQMAARGLVPFFVLLALPFKIEYV